jgi:hypothetical protein
VSHLELINILNPLSSSDRQTEEGKHRIETEKRCALFVELKTEYVIQPFGHLTCDVCSEPDICY